MSKTTSIIDPTGGNKYLQSLAEEEGVDHLQYHSNEGTVELEGRLVHYWYDEDCASPWAAWGAFIKGIGTCNRPSKEEAIEAVLHSVRP